MQTDSPDQFSPVTIVLHWIVGIAMIALLAIGVYMTETETYALYSWHKSFGFIIFFIVMVRVIWRIKNGWPAPIGQHTPFELSLARIIHWVLILGTVLMPVSGFLMSSLSGNGVEVFGLEVVARNPDPDNPRQVIPYSETYASFFHTMHHRLGYLLIAAVLLHIAGAVKHHLIDKDGTLKRMLGSV